MKEVVMLMKIAERFEKIKNNGSFNLADLLEWIETDASQLYNLSQDLNIEVNRMKGEINNER